MESIEDYFSGLKKSFNNIPSLEVRKLGDAICDTRKTGGTIYIMGNGGSGATASHAIVDIQKGTAGVAGEKRFKARSLCDNFPTITAWVNDSEYPDDVFLEQLYGVVEKDDVVIGISASGKSMNVIKAINYANERHAITAGLTGNYNGSRGGRLKDICKINIYVPEEHIGRIEDCHSAIMHALKDYLIENIKSEKSQ